MCSRLLVWGGLVLTGVAFSAEKKPVTLDAISAERKGAGEGFSSPEWAPGGKQFAYRKGSKLMLYDAAARSERELVDFDALEKAAVKPPASGRFGWQNRRVSESAFSWSTSGDDILLAAEGDIFLFHLKSGKWEQLTATPESESDAKLSPDGAWVGYRVDEDLYVLNIASKKTKRITFDGTPTLMNGKLDWVYPEELDLGTAFWWSPDSSRIAYLQFDTTHEFVYPQVDLLGARAVAEPERYPQAGTPNADVRLGVVEVGAETPATRWLDLGETRDALLARVDWIPGTSDVLVQRMNRVQNRLDLLRADTQTGAAKVILRESDPAWINMSDIYRLLSNGKEFLWSSERDGYRHLYLYSTDGKLESRLTEGQWIVSKLAGVDEAARRVYYESTEASPLERHLYRVGFDGKGRTRLSQETGTHAITLSPACDYFLDRYSSSTHPPETSLHSMDGAALAVLRPANREFLDEYDVQPGAFVQVPAADGTTLYAHLIKPRGFVEGKKYPAIVMVYGGPGAQTVIDAWRGAGMEQVFAAKGFVIWQLDNRGSAGRGHGFETPLYRRFGKAELADQLDGIHYLLKQGFVDEKRIGISGWSYGGYMTLYCMLNAPGVFRAGIAGAPVTNWHNYDTIYTERYLGLPQENAEGYKASSAVTYADRLQGDLLILHNIEDDNVLFQNTMQMVNALEEENKPFRMVVYPQKSHGVGGKAARQLSETMLSFFEEKLR
ncbi:MAG TPA: S9 family peptidase [Bryobacteraceae bacterium]|nr:S9 family peptidase [Bryobacteraceae bacterium]